MADSSQGLIDDKGNVFGVLNIIDALAIIILVAIVIGGVTLVLGSGSGFAGEDESNNSSDITHVTIDLGTESGVIAREIRTEDRYAPTHNSILTITDVHRTPAQDGTHVLVRARLRGPTSEFEDTISYNGDPPRLGRYLEIKTETYSVDGQVIDVGTATTLQTQRESVLVRIPRPIDSSRSITEETQFVEAGQVVGSVQSVQATAYAESEQRYQYLNVELRTYQREDRRYFGATKLTDNTTIRLPIGTDDVTGEVMAVGETVKIQDESRDVVVTDIVDSLKANMVQVGDVYRIGGAKVGTIESVTSYGTNRSDRKRIYLGLSLDTVSRDGESYIKGKQLRRGSRINVSTSKYTLRGNVVRLNGLEKRGTIRNRTVSLRLRNVGPTKANAIQEGMVYREGGRTLAEIESVEREASKTTLTTDDGELKEVTHPVNQDLEITATLRVRELPSLIEFNDDPLRPASKIHLAFDGIQFQPEVVSADGS